MPHYLIQATYTHEGLQGLMKDKASGRKAALSKALGSLGAKVEAMYYCFGEYDVIVLVEGPDNITAAAISFAASSTGLVRTSTTPLLSIEETDQAIQKRVTYRGPGQ
jgi:uncharacterized protein with GYD domain